MKTMKKILLMLLAFVVVMITMPVFDSSAESNVIGKQTLIDSITQEAGAKLSIIEDGYSVADRYVVLSGRLKALEDVKHDWGNTVVLGVSGKTKWENYGFQIVYGTSETQNMVKLNNDKGYGNFDKIEVKQSQWYNQAKLEKIFSKEGMDVKLVRFNIWVYLLADMGDGYEMIGRMVLPDDTDTEFTVYNSGTPIRFSKLAIETGKEKVLSSLQGAQLNLGSKIYFPVNSESWTLEGKLTTDFSKSLDSGVKDQYRVAYAGTDGWDSCIAVFLNSNWDRLWRGQVLSGSWDTGEISDTHSTLMNSKEGMWVRWIRSGNRLSLYTSADGISWLHVVDNTYLSNGTTGIYIDSAGNFGSKLQNVRIVDDSEYPTVFEQSASGANVTLSDSLEATFAVLTVKLKAITDVKHDWSNAVVLGVSGTEKWKNFGFQLAFGTSETQNAVKLNENKGYGTFDDVEIKREQSYNQAKLETLFSEEGMNIKIVRLDTWVYLFADMGSGYELIGTMVISSEAGTQFTVFNANTSLRVSDLNVQTGQKEALASMDGISISLSQRFYFPVDSATWTIQTRVKTDFSKSVDSGSKGEYRVAYAGANTWSWNIALYFNTKWDKHCRGQVLTGSWSSSRIDDTHSALMATEEGMWVRWVRNGSTLSLYTSTDGVEWSHIVDNTYLNNEAKGLYINGGAGLGTQLLDVRIRCGMEQDVLDDMNSDSIRIATQPTKTSYRVGELVDVTGMVVELVKNGQTVRTIPLESCKISPKKIVAVSDTMITVEYRDFRISIPITVIEKKITDVRIKDLPYKTQYKKGEIFSADGATYIITYDTGYSEERIITNDICNYIDTTESGEKVVFVSIPYVGDFSPLTFMVSVEEDPVRYEPDAIQPAKGDTQGEQQTQGTQNVAPKTGDTVGNIVPLMIISMILSACIVVFLYTKNQKHLI